MNGDSEPLLVAVSADPTETLRKADDATRTALATRPTLAFWLYEDAAGAQKIALLLGPTIARAEPTPVRVPSFVERRPVLGFLLAVVGLSAPFGAVLAGYLLGRP